MENPPQLGKPVPEIAFKDAIHIAVAPVTANETLNPGQHVGLVGYMLAGPVEKPIGIVDPFLRCPVDKGDKFWLCMYPNTITSLRHSWTHPAFRPQLPEKT